MFEIMKKYILLAYFTFFLSAILNAQGSYQVNTSATNVKSSTNNNWVETIKYNTLKTGMRFMVLSPVKGSAYELEFREKTSNKTLLVKDFGGKIFVYKKWEHIRIDDTSRNRFYFECEGKEYFFDDNFEDENQILNWNIESLIWLDEVDIVKQKLENKTLWLNADSWKYNLNGNTVYKDNPERFSKVTVLQVGVGNYSNYPVRVLFKNEKDQKQYFIDGCVSGTLGSCFSSQKLSDLFLFEDPEKTHQNIKKEFWTAIQNREIKNGMTEEECYLSLGQPYNRDTYKKGTDQTVVLNYQATDSNPFYLTILLKNNNVNQINKSE